MGQEFLGRSSSAEIVFFDIGTFAEGEVRQRHTMSICGFLESELPFGHLGIEVFVKLS